MSASLSPWKEALTTQIGHDVSSIVFDSHHDLVWAGSSTGHLDSYFTNSFSRYTACRAHFGGPVLELLAEERGILSLGRGSVRLTNRRGLPIWNQDGFAEMASMCYATARGSEIVVGGGQGGLTALDMNTGSRIRKSEPGPPISHLCRTSYVCCGTREGTIVLRDPSTLRMEHTIEALAGGFSALESDGNLLLGLAYSLRHGVPTPDPIVKVYDIRALKPLAPISFPAGAVFAKSHPRAATTFMIASNQGQFQMIDLSKPSAVSYHQVETGSFLTALDFAPTGEGMIFADAESVVHLWATSEDSTFNRFSHKLELPDPMDAPKEISWVPDTPLSSIGMPYYNSSLMSILPSEHFASDFSPLFQPQTKIDPSILASMKMVDFVGYAINPKLTLRNQAVQSGAKAREARRRMDVPLFRSEKERAKSKRSSQQNASTEETAHYDSEPEEAAVQSQMPRHYRKVEIQYSKFGVEDFDFGFYNGTKHSGLETHIANSYTNALLQSFFYTEPIRRIAVAHTLSACLKENCMLCEAGFLFRMLEDAKGVNCQASNFSRAFGTSQQAAALGLMDFQDEPSITAYSHLIQICNRFLLDQMETESDSRPNPSLLAGVDTPSDPPSPITQILGLEARTTSLCTCGAQSARGTKSNVIDFVYPRLNVAGSTATIQSRFTDILQTSLNRETLAKTTCSVCHQVTSHRVKREIIRHPLPPVLSINAGIHTPQQMEVWLDRRDSAQPHFLPPRIAIHQGDQLQVFDDMTKVPGNATVYELNAVVVQIQSEQDPAHLVSLIKVDGEGWYVFNDFLVKAVSEEEALSFPGTWKIPSVLFYRQAESKQLLDYSALPSVTDNTILCQDTCISRSRDPASVKHQVLDPDELPKAGSLISIDAEFVSLQQEEVEYHSNGTRAVIRPNRMTLARVSVLRGEGPKTGIPFIDDYIHTSEPIVDYLTEFSGIVQGDLEPTTTRHTLVPLKVAYKKLRLLVDLGCIFIGHGLNKDFRIINIFVPPSQIIDTVTIYHLPHRQRKISLRFLAWVVLQQDIQTGSHDSIEDARTALQLYEQYCRLVAEGMWEEALEDVYREGRKANWKVPGHEPTGNEPEFSTNSQALGGTYSEMYHTNAPPT